MNCSIVYICDPQYVLPTTVSIQSLLSSKHSESFYHVYVIGKGLSEDDVQYFEGYTTTNFNVSVISFDDLKQLIPLNASIGSFDSVSFEFLKVYLPLVLKREKKVLYLEGDVIVQKDLSLLYATELEENMLAAVRDSSTLSSTTKLTRQVKCYFSCGVMLLNLEKMREWNLSSELIKARSSIGNKSVQEQQVLNVMFKDRCLPLELKYNVDVVKLKETESRWSYEKLNQVYKTMYDSVEEIVQDAVIVRFSSNKKPWLDYGTPFAYLWFREFSKIKKSEPLIVSLTSYPARIKFVSKTVNSLLNQSLLPTKIILWLADSQFPRKLDDLPLDLKVLEGEHFEIRWCNDLKSYKKLLPALKEFPDCTLVTADDDILYPRKWLERLYLPYLLNQHKKIIWCHRAHVITTENQKISPYKKWHQCCIDTDDSVRVFCTTGGGVIYPPKCFNEEVFSPNYKKICSTNDDVWFFAMLVLNGYKIKVVPRPVSRISVIDGTQEETLWLTNLNSLNDKSITGICAEYPKFEKILLGALPPNFSNNLQRSKKEVSDLKNQPIQTKRNFSQSLRCDIMPLVNLLLPVGSRRRKMVKDIYSRIFSS